MPADNTDEAVKTAQNAEKIKALGNAFYDFKTEIKQDLKEIKEKLLGRPSWAVSNFLTVAVGLIIGLIIYIVTGR